VQIRTAEYADIETLREIERRAGAMFREIGMVAVADEEPPPPHEFAAAVDAERAFVCEDDRRQQIMGYLLAESVDGAMHIAQVSVSPEYARQRVGQALIDHAAAWAREQGANALTLTTFRDVPWNAPYYERLGFRVMTPEEIGPALAGILRTESGREWGREPRVCMRRDLAVKSS
jgi:GNAT superfamily N-acetyltransferase